MKILFVHNYYHGGLGGEDRVFDIEATLLEAHGHEIIRYTVHNDDLVVLNPVIAAGKALWNNKSYRDISTLIIQRKPDIVHCHNTFPLASPAVYYAAQKKNIPVIQRLPNYRLFCANAYFLRDNKVCEDCLHKTIPWPAINHACYRDSRAATTAVATMLTTHRLLKTWQKQVDTYIALTEFARAKFIEGGLPAKKIVVKPNFVYPDPGLGESDGDYALFVGRLSPEKGLDTLFKAWYQLRYKLPLKIVGDGPLAPMVAEQVNNNTDITWLGQLPKEEVLALMKGARLLVFPSIWYEGFPVVIVEAYSVGLPVVSSNIGNMASLIDDGKTGFHFQPNDPADLADRLNWLMSHPTELQKMRQSSRDEFLAKYTDEQNYTMLMNIYQESISRHTLM